MEVNKANEFREASLSPEATADCPVKKTLELFQGKWSVHVLFELSKVDVIRFGALKKEIDGITNTMLANTLRDLEERGLVLREQFNEIPPHVEYSLTESGKALFPIFSAMATWGLRYATN